MEAYISATPAYGRDYKSIKELTDSFNDGKDFHGYSVAHDGVPGMDTYFSIRDVSYLVKKGYTHIEFKYNKQMKTFIMSLV